MKYEAKMTTRGRVTISKPFRDAMGWHPHDKLEWTVNGGVVTISKLDPSSSDKGRIVETVPAASEERLREQVVPTQGST